MMPDSSEKIGIGYNQSIGALCRAHDIVFHLEVCPSYSNLNVALGGGSCLRSWITCVEVGVHRGMILRTRS